MSNAALTVDPKALTITADDQSKTYGDAVTFDTATVGHFTVVGLVNSDTVDSVTLSSAGAALTATVAGSPYDLIGRAASARASTTTTSPMRTPS